VVEGEIQRLEENNRIEFDRHARLDPEVRRV
jgi:hypothetical protein